VSVKPGDVGRGVGGCGVATTAGFVGAGVAGGGVTLGGGVTVGEADGTTTTGDADGEADGAIALALHAANTTTASRAANRRLNLDIASSKCVGGRSCYRRHQLTRDPRSCAWTNVHNRGVETYEMARQRCGRSGAARVQSGAGVTLWFRRNTLSRSQTRLSRARRATLGSP
jgi:hypothetical protein